MDQGALPKGSPEASTRKGFDFRKYGELVEEHGGERQLRIALASGTIAIVVSAYDDVVHFLDQLPTVKVYLDNGPPDAGPASGGNYTFFIADGVSEPDLKASIDALALALRSDLASLDSNTQ